MSDNPLARRMKKQRTGIKAETKTSKRLGASLTPASGALDGAKSDMVVREWRIENKSTVNESMSLKLDWLLKIKQEALEKSQLPALAIQFTHHGGEPVKGGEWVVIPESVFKEMIDE